MASSIEQRERLIERILDHAADRLGGVGAPTPVRPIELRETDSTCGEVARLVAEAACDVILGPVSLFAAEAETVRSRPPLRGKGAK